MENGLYVALSSQIALEKRLSTIADNMANATTVGFRRTGVKFEDVLTGLTASSVDFVSPGTTFMPDQGGPVRETGNPFDFAVQGDAWFAIETPVGTVMTRDGRFTMLSTGELVTLQGYPVLDAGGAPIQLNPEGGPPKAGADGTLRQGDNLAGALGLYEFQPGTDFQRYGNSGIIPVGRPEPIVDRQNIGVAQGFVEDSNVNAVQEMMRLIQVQRAFDNITALMRDSETALGQAINTLGSPS
ncbi:MAG: flagellar basal-body rod protein FlgF [Rhizobiaceae bacterium]|nr:flagellar basal-body rod protein FlgF [Rhizobiaceae bacterium]